MSEAKAPLTAALPWRVIVLVLACFGLVVGALMVAGVVPAEALGKMFGDALFTPAGLRNTFRESTPLLILGVAVFLALRAGLFNIGADGQFVMGACAGAAAVLAVPGPAGIALGIVVGPLAGALWAWPAGAIKAYRGGHEVITTIMLNNIAFFLTTFLAKGIMRDPGQQSPTTPRLEPSSTLPNLLVDGPFRLNIALFLGLATVPILAWWLKRTIGGYELQATGGNPRAAETAGIEVKKVTLRAMVASGALAGLAGVVQVMAYDNRFYAGFSPGYGFDALGVALLAGPTALALIPSALLFGVLSAGTTAVGLMGVPKALSGILLGCLILVVAAVRYRRDSHGG